MAPLSEAHKEAIRRGHAARRQREREQQTQVGAITQKRCSRCRQMKVVPNEYYMRTRTLVDGTKKAYPSGRCRECGRKMKRADIAKLSPEKLRKMRAKWHATEKTKNPGKIRARQREWSRMNDIITGKVKNPRGPIKKYRAQKRVKVDPTLFLEWMVWVQPRLTEYEQKMVNAAIDENGLPNGKPMEYKVIDGIMARCGAADQLSVFYG